MRFSLDDLQLFLAVARAGTLAAAARRLGVNHSTVFRRLNALEAGMEVRLFERLPEGYVLTAAGEILRVRAERVEEEAQAIQRELSGRDVSLSGRVRVTTTDTLANSFLAPVCKDFCIAYPGMELELLVVNGLLDLSRGEAEIAIRPTSSPPEHLIGRLLGTIRWGVYGARDYVREHAPLATVEAPGDHRFIAGNHLIAHLPGVRWLEDRVPPESVVLRTNGLAAALGAARAGTGLAVLPHFMGRSEPELECLLAIGPAVATDLWLLVHPDLRHAARVRAFAEFATEAIRQRQVQLQGG